MALLLVSATGSVRAQTGYTVVDIEVEGAKRASTSLILGVSSVYKGSPLTATAITETITRLYGLGIFSDVRLEAEEVTGGLKVYIVVEELPKLVGLEFTGNKKIKTKDLKGAAEKLMLMCALFPDKRDWRRQVSDIYVQEIDKQIQRQAKKR